jgi:hypothetical protein
MERRSVGLRLQIPKKLTRLSEEDDDLDLYAHLPEGIDGLTKFSFRSCAASSTLFTRILHQCATSRTSR